jgi:hypothetical protein
MEIIGELNKDQLDGLAKLCFDLAKASLVIALLPATSIPSNPIFALVKMLIGLVWGLAFTYLALVILKAKEKLTK